MFTFFYCSKFCDHLKNYSSHEIVSFQHQMHLHQRNSVSSIAVTSNKADVIIKHFTCHIRLKRPHGSVFGWFYRHVWTYHSHCTHPVFCKGSSLRNVASLRALKTAESNNTILLLCRCFFNEHPCFDEMKELAIVTMCKVILLV